MRVPGVGSIFRGLCTYQMHSHILINKDIAFHFQCASHVLSSTWCYRLVADAVLKKDQYVRQSRSAFLLPPLITCTWLHPSFSCWDHFGGLCFCYSAFWVSSRGLFHYVQFHVFDLITWLGSVVHISFLPHHMTCASCICNDHIIILCFCKPLYCIKMVHNIYASVSQIVAYTETSKGYEGLGRCWHRFLGLQQVYA